MVAACLLHTGIRLDVGWDIQQSSCRGRSCRRGPANGGIVTLSGRTRAVVLVCSLRDKGLSKKPLWRTKEDMSSEAKQASSSLRLAKGEEAVARVMVTSVSRLLKPDLLALLAHLQRIDCCDLAIKVFDYARKEIWYRPETSFYFDMIYMLGRNRMIEKAEYYFLQLQEEGLQPETRIYTEMLAAYMLVDKVDKAMDMYRMMKEAGCRPNELTFTILLRNLQRLGKVAAIKEVENDAVENLEDGEEFLRNVRTRRKNPTLN
ncbi:Pentatricopeptide repeat-containing protein [Nymphaea thermarum]|nr:Pentatricopeptide repeat-containing protein [Nymphaea thermarum]